MERHPKVSICVPVYNAEPYVALFLDSALTQSFDDYEIVLADNCSTDGTYDILRKYQESFPDKVFLYKTDSHGSCGKGRNLTLQKSKGDYIYMCDSDDLILPKALEWLYQEAVEYNADLVCGTAMIVTEEDGEIINISQSSHKSTMQVSNETAIKSGAEFWIRLIKRSLIDKIGRIPDEDSYIFEDVRYLTVLHSKAKCIRFISVPVYYWYRRGNSTAGVVRKELCEDSVDAGEYALANVNPEFVEATQMYVADRARWNLNIRWPFYDVFVNEIRGYSAWFYDNKQIKENSHVFSQLRHADTISNINFPNIIYVDGFAATPTKERLVELREKVFHDGCEIVVLSPENCDVNENEYVKRA